MVKRLAIATTIAFLLTLSLPVTATWADLGQAAGESDARDKAQKSRGAQDKDPNIKSSSDVNDPAKTINPPQSKGGKAERGPCGILFDNWTGWWIKTYVDGNYWGTVAPWGNLQTAAIPGGTRIYARADFTDGSYLTWGPRSFNCPSDGQFTWRLDP